MRGEGRGGFRFPVQYVIRPDQDYRGFAGRVVSGSVRRDDEVVLLPARQKTTIKSIDTPDGPAGQASAGDSVILRLGDEMDLSRGDMIVHGQHPPEMTTRFEADLCWMNGQDLQIGRNYVLLHTTNTTTAVVRAVRHRIDVDSLRRDPAATLSLNEIGRISMETARPVFVDPYRKNSATGSFILVDPDTNVTAAAGMIRAEAEAGQESAQPAESAKSPDTFWDPWNIGREEREARNGHRARVIWLTGVSGAGKTTIGRALERKLWNAGMQTMLLDGDQVRHGLNGDLGFSSADRTENIRRAAEAARLFFEHGNVVICSFVSPNRGDRSKAASLFPDGAFTEVHLHCDAEARHRRDPKGLYRKAREGKIKSLTGYDAEYELPGPETMSIKTDKVGVDEAVELIMQRVFEKDS
jgi:bifunctional enzyme CysN/CysC